MAHKRSAALTTLPPTIHPEQRLTITQACLLRGCGRSKFYDDVRSGRLCVKLERDGRFVRVRAGDLIEAMNGARG